MANTVTTRMVVVGEAWDVDSFDPESLSALAYAKIAGAPIERINCGSVYKHYLQKIGVSMLTEGSFFGGPRVPCVLTTDGRELRALSEIAEHFRDLGHNVDANSSAQDLADTAAFEGMIHDMLVPAWGHYAWLDHSNLSQITRPTWAKLLPLPFNYLIPKNIRQQVSLQIAGESEETITKRAQLCLNSLEAFLGDKDFMLGDKPTYLDAIVFGYVNLIRRTPMPNPVLMNLLQTTPSLEKLCIRLEQKFFKNVAAKQQEQRKKDKDKWMINESNKNDAISVVVALSIVAVYAVVRHVRLT